ncbi:hypothetical protein [Petroclostridium sp. X23]|nr:hypothetical protein [Petroclostridium sp. X23]WHH60273.1 hypothetical protein QKW49_05940 [Petroclostridium sp. X23]
MGFLGNFFNGDDEILFFIILFLLLFFNGRGFGSYGCADKK